MKIETMPLCRPIRLKVVGDKEEVNRVYTYLREGMEGQNRALNESMSALYIAKLHKMPKEDINELEKLLSRAATSKKGSGLTSDIKFAKGLNTESMIKQKVKNDLTTDCKKGLMYGRVSLRNYKIDNPLLIRNSLLNVVESTKKTTGMYHTYSSDEEFYSKLFSDRNVDLFIRFANKITFQMILGDIKKSTYLRKEIESIFKYARIREGISDKKSEEYEDIKKVYKISDSQIEINNKNQIILRASVNIPKQNKTLDENTTVGVDLGIAVPAVCALNNNDYIKRFIGSTDDFVRIRTQLQSQRRRLQRSIRFNKGGHGRAKKIKALNRLKEKERNWVKTYNHQVSSEVVKFAINNNAKYINMEDLSSISESDRNGFILRNWSYYELQQFITYKAERAGIEVRYINPAYTSQTCSCCGNTDKMQRISQSEFVCMNPDCKNYKKVINADFNAARNIAMSDKFITKGKSKGEIKSKEEKKVS